MSLPVVIVGTGLAGYTLARELRKLDPSVPLAILSRDHAGFYSKPLLSNALASRKTAATLVMKPAEKMATELGATVRPRTGVHSIDAAARTLTLDSGETLAYRDLVLALGADPIRVPLAGDASDAVLSVNDLDDYARFADALEGARTVAIMGAGLIGCEFANDLLHRGVVPTVIDPGQRALARLLPEAASRRLQARLEAAGARFCFGSPVLRVDRDAAGGLRLTLADGRELQADVLLSAIGLQARTAAARSAGLAVNRGIVVDRHLRTSQAHIHALGDCAEVEGLSLPFVLPLMQQARALAATLAGKPTPVSYPAMPVVVKTPACPIVVCPPQIGTTGNWQVQETEDACEARYTAEDGRLLGFALLGSATARKQALAALLPAILGS